MKVKRMVLIQCVWNCFMKICFPFDLLCTTEQITNLFKIDENYECLLKFLIKQFKKFKAYYKKNMYDYWTLGSQFFSTLFNYWYQIRIMLNIYILNMRQKAPTVREIQKIAKIERIEKKATCHKMPKKMSLFLIFILFYLLFFFACWNV